MFFLLIRSIRLARRTTTKLLHQIEHSRKFTVSIDQLRTINANMNQFCFNAKRKKIGAARFLSQMLTNDEKKTRARTHTDCQVVAGSALSAVN